MLAELGAFILRTCMHKLRAEIERLYAKGSLPVEVAGQARQVFQEFHHALTRGQVRAAEKHESHWRVNTWVKQGILLGFRLGDLEEISSGAFTFVDKDTFPARRFSVSDRVRVVPGGSSVRSGAYIAPGVICMPPMYVNVGAYVDEGTLIDSHALVGSCAQIGKRVHLSAAAQIGGVLEPLQANPTIIEDNCFIGARSEVVEGVIVEENCVLGMGVFIGQSTRIYNRATEAITYGRVPAGSVVVAGSLPSGTGGCQLYCAVIVKEVDARTRAKTSINELLRA